MFPVTSQDLQVSKQFEVGLWELVAGISLLTLQTEALAVNWVTGSVETSVSGLLICFSLQTWTSRCLMKYYAIVAASSSVVKSQDTVERIERRVLDSNPIMEAFGEITNDRWCQVNVRATTADIH